MPKATEAKEPSPRARKIDDLMERASRALVAMRYFECERLGAEALRAAWTAGDFERMARIALPLQEARRQKRQLACDAGKVFVVDALQDPRLERPEPGVYVLRAPNCVGVDGRTLREHADRLEIPVMILVQEPTTQSGLTPFVAVGPCTVRVRVPAPRAKKDAPPAVEWCLSVMEALGDAALSSVEGSSAAARVERLLERVETVPDHELLHQRLADACREAMHEAAQPGAAKRSRKPARNDDADDAADGDDDDD